MSISDEVKKGKIIYSWRCTICNEDVQVVKWDYRSDEESKFMFLFEMIRHLASHIEKLEKRREKNE